MYTTDKGFSAGKNNASATKSSPMRRRLTSRLQPLHGGLGFGAHAIRERALVVARQASQRRATPSNQTQGQAFNAPVLGPSGTGLQFADEKTVIRELESVPVLGDAERSEAVSNRRESINDHVRRSASAQMEAPGRALVAQANPRAAAVPSIKSFLASPRRPQPPTLAQSLLAWFFDALVVLACLIVGFTLSASVPFMALLAQKFPTLIKYSAHEPVQVGSMGWVVLMMQTLAVSSMLVFLVQAFAGILLSATIGRAIANVHLSTGRSAFGRGFKIGLSELIQWPLAFGLLNAVVSPEHNFFVRSVRWARGDSQQ